MLLSQRLIYLTTFDRVEASVTQQVADIARALGAVVHPLGSSGRRRGLRRPGGSDADVATRENLERVAETLRERRVRVGDTLVLPGDSAVAAMEAAERVGAQTIVVGAGDGCVEDPVHLGGGSQSGTGGRCASVGSQARGRAGAAARAVPV